MLRKDEIGVKYKRKNEKQYERSSKATESKSSKAKFTIGWPQAHYKQFTLFSGNRKEPPVEFGKYFKSETYLRKFCLIAFCLSAVVQGSLSMLWTKPWGKLGKYCRVLLRYRFKVHGGNDELGRTIFCFLQCRKSEGAFSNVSGSLLPRLRDLAHYWWNHRQHEARPRCPTRMYVDADQEVRRMAMIMRRRTRVMPIGRITMFMLIRRPWGWQWWWRCWSWTFQRALLLLTFLFVRIKADVNY